MWRYFKAVFTCIPVIIYAYFAWMIRYSRHPEKYPLEVRYQKARKLIRYVAKHLRVRYEVNNFELLNKMDEPFLLIANHRSDFDPLLFIALSEKPITFVAKIEVKKFPFIGRIVKAIGGVFLNRSDIRQQLLVLKEVERSLNEDKDCSWTIFPEGTRNKSLKENPLLDFHSGSFKIYQRTKAPLIYAALYGTERVFKTKHYKYYPCVGEIFGPINEDKYRELPSKDIAFFVRNKIEETLPSLVKRDEEILKSYQRKKKD